MCVFYFLDLKKIVDLGISRMLPFLLQWFLLRLERFAPFLFSHALGCFDQKTLRQFSFFTEAILMVLATGTIIGIVGGGIGTGILILASYFGFRSKTEQTPEPIPLPQRNDQPEPEPSEALAAEEDAPEVSGLRQRSVSSRFDSRSQDLAPERSASRSVSSVYSDGYDPQSVNSVDFQGFNSAVIAGKIKRRIDRVYDQKKVQIEIRIAEELFRVETYKAYALENSALLQTFQELFPQERIRIKDYPEADDRQMQIDLPWEALHARQVQKFRRTYANILHPEDESASQALLARSDHTQNSGGL
jgi:hypothetical protein